MCLGKADMAGTKPVRIYSIVTPFFHRLVCRVSFLSEGSPAPTTSSRFNAPSVAMLLDMPLSVNNPT